MLMRDKPQQESSSHVNVRDWLNLSRGNIIIEPFVADSPMVAGIKRRRSDSNQSSTSDKSTIENIVRANKKHEIEHEKSNEHALCDKKHSIILKKECLPRCTLPLESSFQTTCGERITLPSVSSSQPRCEGRVNIPSISTSQHECIGPMVTFKSSFYPHSPTKPSHGFPMEVSNETIMTSVSPDLVNRHDTSNLHWKDRFLQVQTFLKACDESSQEDYIQMLRSLSSTDRSKHAAALEKRAIHLLLEEGKELHLMKVLNVFGNASSVDQITLSVDKPSDAED